MDHDKKIMLVAQKEASTDEPGVNDLFTVGTVASILQMLKLPDGTVKVLVEKGCSVLAFLRCLIMASISRRKRSISTRRRLTNASRKCWFAPLSASLKANIKLNKKIPPEVLTSLNSIDDPARTADTIAAHAAEAG